MNKYIKNKSFYFLIYIIKMAKSKYNNQNIFLFFLVIIFIIIYFVIKSIMQKKESFCDSSPCSVCTCTGVGHEICRNRQNIHQLYNNNVTENTISPNGLASPIYIR